MRLETREKDRVRLLLEDTEDLWLASRLIEPGSIVRGSGTRKVAAGEKDVAKKRYTFELDVERSELQASGLRVLGTVRNELEDVPKASHQSILLVAGDRLELERSWDPIAQRRLERALERVKRSYLVVLFDREEASIIEVSGKGSREVERLSGEVARKDYDVRGEDFFTRLTREVERVAQRGYSAVIFAGSSIWIDEIKKREPTIKPRYVEIAGADTTSVRSLLERREVASELAGLQGVDEIGLVEELLRRISTGSKHAYGLNEVERAVSLGAAETVMITQRVIDKAFEAGTFDRIRSLLDAAEASKARIEILDTDDEAMMKLDGLGGIAALLRYDVN